MISYARLTPGRGWRPLQAILYYAYRVGVAMPFGRVLGDAIAAAVNVAHPRPRVIEGDGRLANLQQFGVSTVPAFLTDKQIEEMLGYLAKREPIDNGSLADYNLTDVVNCPRVMALANHPFLLALAGAYLGCAPTISTIGIRWSRPSGKAAPVQSFHRDPDDWKMVKFFTYLTDVQEGTGPHVYVVGTQRARAPLFSQRYSDKDVVAKYGEWALVTMAGPRGTMFMADTSGIHKGDPARTGPRLMLEIGYTLLPVFAFDYQPVRMEQPLVGLDPYVNRLIVKL